MSKEPFLFSLKFLNTLPSAPSGPFFKKVSRFSSADSLREYKVSSLEKGYNWQPNFGPDLGINLDLVDQESILVQELSKSQANNHAELYLLEGSDKSRGKTDLADKPWWLRETTYTSNDLFRSGSKVKSENYVISTKIKQQYEHEVAEDPFSIEFIEETFNSVKTTIESLKNQNKRKIEFSVPLLPSQCIISKESKSVPLFSIVRFDEDPAASEDTEKTIGNKRTKRIDFSIITNFRLSKDQNRVGKQSVFETTLVAPYNEINPEGIDEEKSEDTLLYDWVKDYSMDVQNHNMGDSFLFFQNERGGSDGGEISYIPYSARVEMKKLNAEDSTPHECFVTRNLA